MHGNAVAFRAALADLEGRGAELIVSLGDVAQGGPQPAECVDLLRELDCPCVYGNSDDFLLTLDLGAEEEAVEAEERERIIETLQWSREQLGEERLEFLRSFQPTIRAGRILCCHATPKSNEDVILPETPPAEAERALEGVDADAVAAGHVHMQWLRRFEQKLWFCVGTVGAARSCEYALVDDELAVEFRRIPFDVDERIADARAKNFPHFDRWVASWKL
jgi:diadenosine tetraphosphatase ApaH/serine/threonine PP2A family protein phosphatase